MNIIILIIILAIISSCSCEENNANEITNAKALFIIPDIPIRGEKIKIYYNSNHPDAIYNNIKELYCDITFLNFFSYSIIRNEMIDDNGIYYCEITIPENANNIDIDIVPKNIFRTKETMRGPIYNKDGDPVKGSLSYFISTSKSYEEALQYYLYDKKHYPLNYSRNTAIWLSMLRNNHKTESILFQADSLYYFLMHDCKLSYVDKLTGLTSCYIVYSKFNLWSKVDTLLTKVIEVHQGKLIIDFYAYSDIMFRELFDNTDNDIKTRLLNKIDSLVMKDTSVQIENRFFDFYIRNEIYDDISIIYKTVKDKVIKIFKKRKIEDENTFISLLISLNFYNEKNGNFSDIVFMTKNSLNIMKDIFAKNYWIEGIELVGKGPLEGRKGALIRQLYKAQLNIGDTINAYKTMRNYLEDEKIVTEFNRGTLSLTAIQLFDVYFIQNNLSEAILALERAFELKSPFAEERFTLLQKRLKEAGKDTLGLDYFKSFEVEAYPIPKINEIKCTNSIVSLNKLKDTVLFIFIMDEQCDACNLGLEAAIDTLSIIHNHPLKILVASKKNSIKIKNTYGEHIVVSQFPEYISSTFEITRTPALIIIKNNRVIEKVINFTTNRQAYIKYLNNAISQ
jgi:hypothetical protein